MNTVPTYLSMSRKVWAAVPLLLLLLLLASLCLRVSTESCPIGPLQYMACCSIFERGKPWPHTGQDIRVVDEKVEVGISFSVSSLLPTSLSDIINASRVSLLPAETSLSRSKISGELSCVSGHTVISSAELSGIRIELLLLMKTVMLCEAGTEFPSSEVSSTNSPWEDFSGPRVCGFLLVGL